MRALPLLLAGLLALSAPAIAVQPDEVLKNPVLEQRARGISSGLRCLVCQNQSIDDSDAPLAKDLRILVRERLTAGDSDRAVIDFIVARYGDFVLLRPPMNARTIALWAAPFLIVLSGAVFLWRRRNRSVAPASAALSADEQARLDELMKRGDS
ncbi:Cytochrome c-type biogenesis protein CcmH [Bosea sp. 62]|uniref:cytochrome c-type biogenesis protein n=1 Tax=unclassified Bosea (in: a-proteobacteria) TaxID=2653178 RepID=UPI0012526815|nr:MULTISPECIES: cytochrome c-type biogenesis protein [unclassified Bosea (in: a-proteobacteria)]CAD5289672.1 Cytochrome c-type biogenesis protein CcmH [Bosea sp. 7B]CAD5300251.1 Cytochrome c-type biogenesis protein CcmH [Bosea sp. 21B]CAD5300750.1 Cytochrome c-type biogenesis protein CcmH [Bosea sp. 46]VVT61953.1 Cytochrome c-type biogenesis protein CcmH [Bosea sp. EC-HK365B]VXB47520.1 Cytochrome c-type biogenesis protein CcmH [Bosea sp. 125]